MCCKCYVCINAFYHNDTCYMVNTTLDCILSSGDTLYQQMGKCGKLLASDIPTYMCVYNCQFKVFEKQLLVTQTDVMTNIVW